MPDELHCPTCGASLQDPDPACRDCAEERECRHLRERLFGSTPELTLAGE